MAAHFLMISERSDDFEFGKFLAETNALPFHLASTRDEVRQILTDHPQTVVFWDAEKDGNSGIADSLSRMCPANKVFAITSDSLNTYPELIQAQVFGHHLVRRYQDPAPLIFSKLVGAAITPYPFGLRRYFPDDTRGTTIALKRSSHKTAAVDALQNVFTKQSIPPRIAALAAKAADELIMNALFDAPVDGKGVQYRRQTERSDDFELSEKEQIEVEIASSQSYIGIRVADQFGSLRKDLLLAFLAKDYQAKGYTPHASQHKSEKGAGLGLYGITESGISILFVCKPGIRTEVMIFLEKTREFKQFRKSFRFISILSE